MSVVRSLTIQQTGCLFFPDEKRQTASASPEVKLRWVLHDLCVDWGFCIPTTDIDRIARTTHLHAETFADEVLRAEGFVPEYEKKWRRLIERRVIERFGSANSVKN